MSFPELQGEKQTAGAWETSEGSGVQWGSVAQAGKGGLLFTGPSVQIH